MKENRKKFFLDSKIIFIKFHDNLTISFEYFQIQQQKTRNSFVSGKRLGRKENSILIFSQSN